MSYQERRALVSLLCTLLIPPVYARYALSGLPAGDPYAPEVLRFWGNFFVGLIVISVGVRVVITIVFSIVNTVFTRQVEPDITDERDRLVELKAMRNGQYIFSLGFIGAMVALAAGGTPSAMFALLIVAGVFASAVDELSQFWFYRRGV
jgi:hypothetical protein